MRPSTFLAVLALAAIVGWIVYNQPVQKEHRYAPAGTYYLKEYVSFSTGHGVTGVESGESVRLVRVLDAKGEQLRVAGRDGEFDVSADLLTNDLDVAEAIRQQDQSTQADFHAKTAAISQQQAEQQSAFEASRAQGVQQNSVATSNAAAVGAYSSSSRLHEPATAARGSYSSSYYYYPSSGSPTGASGSSAVVAGRGGAGGVGTASGSVGGPRQMYTQDPATRLQLQGSAGHQTGSSGWR